MVRLVEDETAHRVNKTILLLGLAVAFATFTVLLAGFAERPLLDRLAGPIPPTLLLFGIGLVLFYPAVNRIYPYFR